MSNEVKTLLFTKDDIIECTENAIIRAITCRSHYSKKDKDGNITSIFSPIEGIPKEDRFIQLDMYTKNEMLQWYRYTNDFYDWKSRNKTYIDKNGKEKTIDAKMRQNFIYSVNPNLSNECYAYALNVYNRNLKYMEIKCNFLKITDPKLLKWYNNMLENKKFQSMLENYTYFDVVGNKEYKLTILMFKLAKIFPYIMLNAYKEKHVTLWKDKHLNIDIESISNYENEESINQLGSTIAHYDNIEVYDMLIKELSDTELSIISDIKKGRNYEFICSKYGISSKTISKLKNKVFKLLSPVVDKKSSEIIDNEYKHIVENIKSREIEYSKGMRERRYFDFIHYKNKNRPLKIKDFYIHGYRNIRIRKVNVSASVSYYRKLDTVLNSKISVDNSDIKDINDKRLIGNPYYDYTSYNAYANDITGKVPSDYNITYKKQYEKVSESFNDNKHHYKFNNDYSNYDIKGNKIVINK